MRYILPILSILLALQLAVSLGILLVLLHPPAPPELQRVVLCDPDYRTMRNGCAEVIDGRLRVLQLRP